MTANDQLWQEYRANRDPEIRAQLIGQYLGLVHHVVRQIAVKVGDAVAYEDLVGAGMVGLVVAFEAFDLDRGTAFTTYATQRIRGSVLDELRAADPRTRQLRDRGRELQRCERELHEQLDRMPRPDEVAARLGIELSTYWEWKEASASPVHVPLDSPVMPEPRARNLVEVLPAEMPAPDAGILAEEKLEQVRNAIAFLPEQQRTVLALCYFEGLTLRQIAEVLQVTESRISQVRTAALKALRQDLINNSEG